MLLSGGVSAGKYDLVEEVLAEFGAEFFFTGVRMQPGRPVVFGRVRRVSESASQRVSESAGQGGGEYSEEARPAKRRSGCTSLGCRGIRCRRR